MHLFYADARNRAATNPAVESHINRNGFWFPEGKRFDDPLTDAVLAESDAVVIVTDHKSVDYQRVIRHAAIVVDTHNVTAGLDAGRARVVSLASPRATPLAAV